MCHSLLGQEKNDALLLTYLAALTKEADTLNDVMWACRLVAVQRRLTHVALFVFCSHRLCPSQKWRSMQSRMVCGWAVARWAVRHHDTGPE